MAIVEIDDDLWAQFCSLSERFETPGPGDCLKWCLRRIIKFEEVADGRYVPVCCAVVTREVHVEDVQELARLDGCRFGEDSNHSGGQTGSGGGRSGDGTALLRAVVEFE